MELHDHAYGESGRSVSPMIDPSLRTRGFSLEEPNDIPTCKCLGFTHQQNDICFDKEDIGAIDILAMKRIHGCQPGTVYLDPQGIVHLQNFQGIYYLSHQDVMHLSRLQNIWNSIWKHDVLNRFQNAANEMLGRVSRYKLEWGKFSKEDVEEIMGCTYIHIWGISICIYLILWTDGTRTWKMEEQLEDIKEYIDSFEHDLACGRIENLIL
jgi:hypothetical protein